MRSALVVGIFLCTLPAVAAAQTEARTELIENALSAAPASIASGATVMDFENKVLRKGSNGWVCLPDHPEMPNNSPMCLDAPWLEFIGALMSKKEPQVKSLGIGYMLQGDMPVSNIDPFATTPTAANQWVENSGPHIMLIVPDARQLETLPSDPKNGGPWVMWKGTPYAHVMIPSPALQSPSVR